MTPRVYYFCRTKSGYPGIPSITHIDIYHGWSLSSPDVDFDDEKLVINISAGPVYMPCFHPFLVTEELADKLRPLTSAEFKRKRIEQAFAHPVNPFDGLEKKVGDLVIDTDRMRSFIWKHVTRDRPSVQSPDLYGVIANKHPEKDGASFPTHVESHEIDHAFIMKQLLLISRELVEHHGIMRSHGYLCSDRVFRILEPHIRNPFFVVCELRKGKPPYFMM